MKYRARWAMALLVLLSSQLGAQEAYDWGLPDWVPVPRVPADNSITEAKVELGRRLFYDTRLSADETISCATCHDQKKAFTDGKALPIGIYDVEGVRSSMSLVNVAYLPALTWANPAMASLEAQALVPIFGSHPVEMGMEGKDQLLIERLQDDQVYREMFADAFSGSAQPISLDSIVKAIASFERSLNSFRAPYFRFKYEGDETAISDSAKRGEDLFFSEKLECYHCHGGLNFTDNIVHARLPFEEFGFHNTGLYNVDGSGQYLLRNPGAQEITDDPDDNGKFRTPSLLNIELTAPYMHDGSIATLEEVLLDHYALQGRAVLEGQRPNPNRSMFIVGFKINDQELQDVIEFLKSLTDEEMTNDPRFSNPFE